MRERPLDTLPVAFAQAGEGALKLTDVRESNRRRGDRVLAQRGRDRWGIVWPLATGTEDDDHSSSMLSDSGK
jgi:hypothetical protein